MNRALLRLAGCVLVGLCVMAAWQDVDAWLHGPGRDAAFRLVLLDAAGIVLGLLAVNVPVRRTR